MFKKKQQPPSQPDIPTESNRKQTKKEGLTGVLSPRQKFEEEVTLDLNTTQTNQEREYREFIMYEIKTESAFIINECTYHSIQLAVCAGIVCIPKADQPVAYALLCYLFLGIVLRFRGRLQRMRTGAKYVLSRTALQIMSLLVTACFLLTDEVLLSRICIPVNLLISGLEIVQEFLDFSDTIDEVFTVKIFLTLPRIIYSGQFTLICLKLSQIVDWTWTTVLCLLYLVMVFAVVGLISLGTGLVMKSIRACKNEATRKELFLITTVWLYLSLQVASAVLGYLGVGGTLLISQYNTETGETKSADQPRHSIQNVNVILCLVVMGLQLVWLVPRCIWRRKLGDLFSFMFLQFVDPRILEMKTQDLKIKINYPLFLKKSKSNMFQKAIREDFESQGLKKDRKSVMSTSTQQVEIPGVLKNSDNIKMSEKLKEQRRKHDAVGGGMVMQAHANPSTAKENILSSGGFYSSRGGERQTLNYSTDFNRGNRFALGKKDQQMIKEHFDTGEDLEEGQKPTKQSRRILVQSARDGDLNIEVFKEPDCGLVNKILLKNMEDVEEPIEAGKSTKRDKFEITKYNEKEATERFKSTARDKNDDDDGLCVICFTNIPNAVFLDCGHGGVCIDCSIDSMKRNNSCLLCRKLVVQILEIESLKETDGLFKVLNSFYVSTFHKK